MLNNKVYDILKWAVLIAIPALAGCYASLALVWGWPWPDEVSRSANIICAALGSLLGISTIRYNTKE